MAGTLTISTLNDSSGVLATQNGMTGIAKAWVNFNGSGGATIRGSFNVSSVTRTATGNYTVSFTTAMPNANYSCQVTPQMGGYMGGAGTTGGTGYNTGSVLVNCVVDSGTYQDSIFMSVTVNA